MLSDFLLTFFSCCCWMAKERWMKKRKKREVIARLKCHLLAWSRWKCIKSSFMSLFEGWKLKSFRWNYEFDEFDRGRIIEPFILRNFWFYIVYLGVNWYLFQLYNLSFTKYIHNYFSSQWRNFKRSSGNKTNIQIRKDFHRNIKTKPNI